VQLVGGLHVGFGTVHGAVHLVVFLDQLGEMRVFLFQRMDGLGLAREFFGQFVRRVRHCGGLLPASVDRR
jgi:hypothetical protein